jgi:hypothetical protein
VLIIEIAAGIELGYLGLWLLVRGWPFILCGLMPTGVCFLLSLYIHGSAAPYSFYDWLSLGLFSGSIGFITLGAKAQGWE